MALAAVQEFLDGGARIAACTVVIEDPLRRFPGRVRQALPPGKRAGFVGECGPSLDIECDTSPGPGRFQDRPARVEHFRPGYVVAAEVVEPVDGGADFLCLVPEPVEMRSPCVPILVHGPPEPARCLATPPPGGVAVQLGWRAEFVGGRAAGAFLQFPAFVEKLGGLLAERADLLTPLFAIFGVGDDSLRPWPSRVPAGRGSLPIS